ncbi:hypothetical protein KY284_033207 [Solanum tuberosum]|nr:hypothetical protein KY284_033207 [Solanum tuberosum]
MDMHPRPKKGKKRMDTHPRPKKGNLNVFFKAKRGWIRIPALRKFEEMTIFRQYISPSTRLRHLIVETEEGEEQTRFLTHAPLVGRYANQLPFLKNPFHMANWTSVHTHTSNNLLKLWSLQAPDHHHANIAAPLPSLGRRIIQGEIRWGNTMTVEGEYRHIPGYWEWTEDILCRSQEVLGTTQIYDTVYASLFTYDRNSNILQAFCEAWCPKTNTFLTSVGELSISLWDLYVLEGLPIWGSLYEEIVPEVKELVGSDEKRTKYIPRTCEYLFAAFHHLRGANQEVSFSKWISFWCKKPQRYEAAPPREEKMSARPESTHNPSGVLPDTTTCRRKNVFWTWSERTFKMASFMASERKISLAILVLASIYNGLNKILTLSQLNQIKVCFPIHYVYGWLAHYFRTHYAFSNGPFIPTMVVYSGEGGSKYFNSDDARKHIHGGENVAWTSTMLDKMYPHFYVDNNHASEEESSYFMSIRFNYLPLRCRDSFIVEPYSPHRFGRQFGFYQNIPGIMKNDIRSASLDKGLTFWRICTMSRSMSRATFPSITPNAGKSFGSDYQAWWKKIHGKFLDDHLQALVDAARPIPLVHLECSAEVNNEVLNADLMKPPSMTQVKRAPHVSCDEVKDDSGYDVHKNPPPALSVFDGKKVILDAQKDFISALWNVIKGKLSRSDVDSASSLRDEIQVIIKEMDCKDMDVSPLKKLLNSFFDFAASYDQARSTLHDMDVESAIKELFVAAGERLTNSMFEEQDKVEEVSSLRQSLDSMKKEIRALCQKVARSS